MRVRLLVATVMLFGALFLRPAPASAGLHICNKTANSIWMAVAVLTGDCLFTDCTATVRGWYRADPGNCATPIAGYLATDDETFYYIYAYDQNGTVWGGEAKYCVDPQYAFTYDDAQETACASGVRKGFRSIKTGRYTDYTFNLTPS